MNLKALPQAIEITRKRIHSILGHTKMLKKLADGNHIVGLELLKTIPDPQIPQFEIIIQDENTNKTTTKDGDT
jgi:hypothetical protein